MLRSGSGNAALAAVNWGSPTGFVEGSHAYGYTNGLLVTDTWTLYGITRVQTYTYTNGLLTAISDWV